MLHLHLSHLHLSYLSGLHRLSRFAVDTCAELTQLGEVAHAAAAGVPPRAALARASARSAGGSGAARVSRPTWWGGLRRATLRLGDGLDAVFGRLGTSAQPRTEPEASAARAAMRSALNGAFGDALAARGSELAIRMQLRRGGRALELRREALARDLPQASGHVVVLVHGLCMNDLQWRRRGHDHGEALARDLGCTPLYLHYNTGLPIPANGRRLARLLVRLLAHWPVPVERLSIVGHSMGGLVARSACAHAQRLGLPWLSRLDALACLGSPHRGAPLERAVHWVDERLGAHRLVGPMARIGRVRSAGITGLRHGTVDDCPGGCPSPALPERVRCLAVAATLSRRGGDRGLRGDGLVPVASALGHGADGEPDLFAADARCIVRGADHWGLLDRPEVYRRLRDWLA